MNIIQDFKHSCGFMWFHVVSRGFMWFHVVSRYLLILKNMLNPVKNIIAQNNYIFINNLTCTII
jgi:hypothetical protein